MSEKSEAESKALPANREGAKDAPPVKPETQPGRISAFIGSKRFSFVTVALLMSAIAAASAAVALYGASRPRFGGDQKAAFDELKQSLNRMERQIATSQVRRDTGSAAGEHPNRSSTESSGLLDAANLRYRDGQFQEAAAAYRMAMDSDLAASFTDETHYRYAQSLLKTGNADGALVEFQMVETGFPGSPYFASAATETARLLYQKKSYSQARRVLYELIAARDRLTPADKSSVEHASFFIARCYEAEADSLDASLHSASAAPQRAPLARADNPEHAEGK